jgi:hypothetical protein
LQAPAVVQTTSPLLFVAFEHHTLVDVAAVAAAVAVVVAVVAAAAAAAVVWLETSLVVDSDVAVDLEVPFAEIVINVKILEIAPAQRL